MSDEKKVCKSYKLSCELEWKKWKNYKFHDAEKIDMASKENLY